MTNQIEHAQAAMGLCLADSLLYSLSNGDREFNGSDARARFHTWWFFGLNNAFRKDDNRGSKSSVGLGGNIANSIYCLRPGLSPPPAVENVNEDSGIGSIMRLAPVALAFHRSLPEARSAARASSFTTHPGPLAAECCSFLAHLLVRAIHWETTTQQIKSSTPPIASVMTEEPLAHLPGAISLLVAPSYAQVFLEEVVGEYCDILEKTISEGQGAAESATEVRAAQALLRLLRSSEPDGSTERCWNWRASSLHIHATLRARGQTYNGYPVLPGYFGSFCMDGLALSLWSVYHSASFDDAVAACVNCLGDADSTGAVAGQIAGALYGATSIHPRFRAGVREWDDGDSVVRAALLFHLGSGSGAEYKSSVSGGGSAKCVERVFRRRSLGSLWPLRHLGLY